MPPVPSYCKAFAAGDIKYEKLHFFPVGTLPPPSKKRVLMSNMADGADFAFPIFAQRK